jgi:hypothetical protein
MGAGHLHDLGDLCGCPGKKDGFGDIFFDIGIIGITQKVFFRGPYSILAQNGFELSQDLLGQHGLILSCGRVLTGKNKWTTGGRSILASLSLMRKSTFVSAKGNRPVDNGPDYSEWCKRPGHDSSWISVAQIAGDGRPTTDSAGRLDSGYCRRCRKDF